LDDDKSTMKCFACEQDNAEGARFCGACGAPLPRESGDRAAGLVGTVLGGRYAVTRVIAEGGMGVVYAAEQQMGPLTREVAIKTLLPELSRDPALAQRFYRESGTVAQLEHPNTIKLFEFGETPDGALYIAMEFVRGQPLTELIAQGPIPLPRAGDILRQVCGALDEAHGLGIVHRDLKPDNIVLTKRAAEGDFVKLLDFGIATRTTESAASQTKLTEQGQVLGTPPYMSPEQLAGEPLDARSDIYSLGVIAYEMLTGRLPFEAKTPWQWAQKHMTEAPLPLGATPVGGELPAHVERAVMRALSKAPAQRPASTLEFFRDLSGQGDTQDGSFASGTSPMQAALVPPAQYTVPAPITPAYQTTSAVAAPVAPPLPARSRSRRGWPVALGALLVVASALAVVALRSQSHGAGAAPSTSASVAPPSTQLAPMVDTSRISATPVYTPLQPPVTPSRAEHTEARKPPPKPNASAAPAKPKPKGITLPIPSVLAPILGLPSAQPAPSAAPAPAPETAPSAAPSAPSPTPAPPAPPQVSQGNAACRQSMSLASAENIEAAVAAYQRCANTGGGGINVAAARNRIRSTVAAAVQHRAFDGNCAGARAAANAASQIGVNAGQTALARTSCGD
jgi:eukaryotic-like serine/threonine-protein kinase